MQHDDDGVARRGLLARLRPGRPPGGGCRARRSARRACSTRRALGEHPGEGRARLLAAGERREEPRRRGAVTSARSIDSATTRSSSSSSAVPAPRRAAHPDDARSTGNGKDSRCSCSSTARRRARSRAAGDRGGRRRAARRCPAARCEVAGEHGEQRGLAGAVGPDERERPRRRGRSRSTSLRIGTPSKATCTSCALSTTVPGVGARSCGPVVRRRCVMPSLRRCGGCGGAARRRTARRRAR